MFDKKVVRRRRAALAVFVGMSVVLLTAYFGESGGGVLHALQRGAQEALAPLETGASRALKPTAAAATWTMVPISTPRIEASPARRPACTLRVTM